MAYTKEEIQGFKEKDLRISKLAILKSLIEKCDLEDVNEVLPITGRVDRYMEYINGVTGGCVATSEEVVDWGEIAVGLNLAIPNATNIKMLNVLLDEHKKAGKKASANPSDILTHIINRFGQLPTKLESVKKILETLT